MNEELDEQLQFYALAEDLYCPQITELLKKTDGKSIKVPVEYWKKKLILENRKHFEVWEIE